VRRSRGKHRGNKAQIIAHGGGIAARRLDGKCVSADRSAASGVHTCFRLQWRLRAHRLAAALRQVSRCRQVNIRRPTHTHTHTHTHTGTRLTAPPPSQVGIRIPSSHPSPLFAPPSPYSCYFFFLYPQRILNSIKRIIQWRSQELETDGT